MSNLIKPLILIASTALSCFTLPAMAEPDSNVAQNGTVTIDGGGFGDWSNLWGTGSLASLATVTDGLFLPVQQKWNVGTVFWKGTLQGDADNFVTISLPKTATVSSLILQVDNNDDYLVQYRNAANSWQDLLTIVPYRSYGMEKGSATLSTPVTTSAFRIRSNAGDGYYSISEFQAVGTIAAVPEPETYAMLLAGLGLMGTVARRRKAAKN